MKFEEFRPLNAHNYYLQNPHLLKSNMKIYYLLTTWFVKILTAFLRITGKGRGTALPGLIIEKYFSSLIPYFFSNLPYVILITGTNGKTTTRTMLVSMLSGKSKVVHNKSGSNLIRGILSELILQTNFWGQINADYAVLEVEEATMPKLTKYIKPEQIIITNLYRDQLDAYGEIDRTENFIKESILNYKETTVILNNDDPKVRKLNNFALKTLTYSLNDKLKNDFLYEGEEIQNGVKSDYMGVEVVINYDLTTSYKINNKLVHISIPGYYHVYNSLAAIASATYAGVNIDECIDTLSNIKPAFGRGELLELSDKKVMLLLVKNPAGFNLNLKLLKNIDKPNIVMLLNDNIADGKDVSWIWDSSLEILNEINPSQILLGGTRLHDMHLRIKYAYENNSKITTFNNLESLVKQINSSNKEFYYIFSTYTAMLQFRKLITGNALNV